MKKRKVNAVFGETFFGNWIESFWESAPDGENSPEGTPSSFGMGMGRIMTTKIDHFSVTIDRSSFIVTTVMPQMTFHQPRLGVLRIDFQNTVEKYLGNIPAFVRNGPRRV